MILRIELHEKEAAAFAEFLKRAGFEDYQKNATNKEEVYDMLEAGEKIRAGLSEAGFSPK